MLPVFRRKRTKRQMTREKSFIEEQAQLKEEEQKKSQMKLTEEELAQSGNVSTDFWVEFSHEATSSFTGQADRFLELLQSIWPWAFLLYLHLVSNVFGWADCVQHLAERMEQ